ncbi:fibronectin type III domain-containing protein [Acetobacterium wieringae]|uniref:fibronectin type III domain-containing protein n=1 Tax=Acetobacterium wieringae TaxID=52694 RepID=UPI002B2098C2|nr:fibronectin type III domain-containing protein [Acetobacterium wieringae]MEA4805530.1 fibronectin type III domain-containing protein [Acetobacterium wieringae]
MAANEGAATTATPDIGVAYRGHIENQGDMPKPIGTLVAGPNALGTRGQSLRVEGFWIELTGADLPAAAGISYQVHVQNEGWMAVTGNGKFAGTQGKSQRIEAIKINLNNMPGYDVYYRGHVQNVGDIPQIEGNWGWVKNGAELGTTGSSLRLEELQVKIVKQESATPADIVYKKAGTYGPKTGSVTIDNNVIIDKSGVTLQNTVINGDLTIGEGVGDGDVVLNNVTVKGTTYVKGGGKDSIHINGGDYKQVVMMKTESGQTRIVAIDANNIEVVIAEDATGEEIILEGAFDKVTIDAPKVVVNTQGDTKIAKLDVGKEATDSDIKLAKGTAVADLAVSAPVKMTGEGTIEKADVHSDGVSFETAPAKQNVDPEVKTPPVITPPVVDPVKPPVIPPVTPTPGGGGGITTIPITYLAITGNSNVGATLSVIPTPANATGTYQWYRAAFQSNDFTPITGATGKNYTLQPADENMSIRAVITGTGAYSGTWTSISVDKITNLKELTRGNGLDPITITSDEHLIDLRHLYGSGKLPTEFTVTDGKTIITIPIKYWEGDFDGTTLGTKTITPVWSMPEGYQDVTDQIIPIMAIDVNIPQTFLACTEKEIISTNLGGIDNGNIVNVPINTNINDFLTGMLISPYATHKMLNGDGQPIDPGAYSTTNVSNEMRIQVIAEDGSTASYGIRLSTAEFPQVGAVRNLQIIPTNGDVFIKVDEPASMTAVKGFEILFSSDGMTWGHKRTILCDEYYNPNTIQAYMSIVSGMINTTTKFTHVKVVTLANPGHADNMMIAPIDFTITIKPEVLSIIANRLTDGQVAITLPEDRADSETYMYQIFDAAQNKVRSDLIVPQATMYWQDAHTILLPNVIVPSDDITIKMAKISNGTTTGLTATDLPIDGVPITALASNAKELISTAFGTIVGDTVIGVPAGMKVSTFKTNIDVSDRASLEILDGPGGQPVADQQNANVTAVMKIQVTAENNTTCEYAIEMASTLASPTNLSVTAGDQSANLSWNPAPDATAYSIYMTQTSGSDYGEIAAGITGTTYTVTGLTPGQTYYYAVAATAKNYNESPKTNDVQVVSNVTTNGNVLLGNRLIISNESIDISTSQSTGALNAVVAPSSEMLVSEKSGEYFRLNPEIPLDPQVAGNPVNASVIPEITSTKLDDIHSFFTYNYTNPSVYDSTPAHCGYIGTYVEVWIENGGSPVQLSNAEAAIMGAEFDTKIYELITNNFYGASDVDNNGKIIILCYDIKDGYTDNGSFIGGYWNPNNQFAGETSNNADMIFVDTYPLIGTEKDLAASYSTMAHELQHLVNFNCNYAQTGRQMATWLNEGLSQAAEHMYNGVQDVRVNYYNDSAAIADGRSVLDWQNADVMSSYSLSYLFTQYLKEQAELKSGGTTDIFAKIIQDPGDEVAAVTNVIQSDIDSKLTLAQTLTNFRVATVVKSPVGSYGFGNDATAFSGVNPKISLLNAAELKGGGALIRNIEGSPFTVPETHGTNMRYISVY